MENITRCFIIVFCFSVADSFQSSKTAYATASLRFNNIDPQQLKRVIISGDDDGGRIISLLDFKATYNGNFTLLEWRTNKDVKNPYILEVSIDEENYFELAEIKSSKLSGDFNYYSFIDNNNLLKDSYYRLKHISEDKRISYSEVVMVKVNPLNQLRLFPIPTKNILNIKGFMEPSAQIEVKVTDFSGATYPVYNLNKVAEDHYTVDFSSLKPNTYIVKISSNGKSALYRVLKL